MNPHNVTPLEQLDNDLIDLFDQKLALEDLLDLLPAASQDGTAFEIDLQIKHHGTVLGIADRLACAQLTPEQTTILQMGGRLVVLPQFDEDGDFAGVESIAVPVGGL